MDLPHLDKDRPLADQLAAHYRQAIEAGRLRPGERLPTIREVAAHTGVTRSTVQDAYRRLGRAGLVDATVGRGTTVCGVPRATGLLSPGAAAAFEHLMQTPQPLVSTEPLVCNFAELNPDQARFPVVEFAQALEQVLAGRGRQLLGYGQPTGDPELRRLLAAMSSGGLGDVDFGGGADPDEVLITNGAQQGIDLVLRTFTRPGDAVAVAIPTYHHLFGLLKAHDLRVVPLSSDGGRIDPAELSRVAARDDVRLLYVMPTFHNPTGRTMDRAQRELLMATIQETRVPVLEDEFELDLRFRGEPLPSLRSLDARDLTVTVRTFSKGLFPGVRLGWVHAGSELRGPMAALKRFIDLETSPLLQAALVEFLRSGSVGEYVTILREAIENRQTAATEALEAHMPEGFTWTDPDGGFLRWLEGPPGFDGDRFARAAAARGVLVAPGSMFYVGAEPVAGVRLSLARASEAEVRDGIEVLAACATELTASKGPAERPIIL